MLHSSTLLATPALLGLLFFLPPAVAKSSKVWQPSPPYSGAACDLPHCSDMGLLAQASDSDQEDQDKRLVLSNTELTLVEGEKGTAFKVRLSSKLKESEVVNVTIKNDNEENITVSPTSLEFTEDNWKEWQDINISLENHEIDEDNLSVTISLSPSGAGYDKSNEENLNLTVKQLAKKLNILLESNLKNLRTSHEDEEKLIKVDGKLQIRDNTKLSVIEGESLVFHVNLSSEPENLVRVQAMLTDDQKKPIDMNNEDFSITPSFLEFSDSNNLQSITLSLKDDKIHEKKKIIRICFDPVGEGYNESVILDITIIDNDTPELVLNSSELIVTEGGSGSFSVELDNKPIEPVVVRVAAVKNKDEDFEKVFLDSDYFVKSFYLSKEYLDNAETEQLQNLKTGFSQFFPINLLDDLEETRRTFQALVKNFSHFNSEFPVTDSHFLVFSVYNWNIPQSVTISANENQYNGDDRWVTISLDPSGEGYDNNQLKKDVEVKIKDKNKNENTPDILAFTLIIGGNILAFRFAIRAKINDIDIKFQDEKDDLLSQIDKKVTQIQTEIEEIKDEIKEG